MNAAKFFYRHCPEYFLPLLLTFILPSIVIAQQENSNTDSAWLKNHAQSISIDPGNTDYSDLQSLKQSIGDSKMVMLGEQSHGDGTTFEAKIRLIKFLHEEMGFDVLAFESGFYDCSKAWESFCNNENPETAGASGVFGIWSYSKEVQPLFHYLAGQHAANTPLELTGFDCKFSASASTKFNDDLESKLTLIHSQTLQSPDWSGFRKQLTSLVENEFPPVPKARELKAFDSTLFKINQEFARATELPLRDQQFWIQECQSLKGLREMVWTYHGSPLVKLATHAGKLISMRDEQMADNLLWLKNVRFADKKIIVWAASMHIQHGSHYGFLTIRMTSMGTRVFEKLGSDVYSIGFIAGGGRAGACFQPEAFTIAEPKEKSLEALFRKTGFQNAFIDFRRLPANNFLTRQKMQASPFGYMKQKKIWSEYFDGMIYTANMKRSTYRWLYPNGEVEMIIYYDVNQNMNRAIHYDEHGKKLIEEVYENGKRISRIDYKKQSEQDGKD